MGRPTQNEHPRIISSVIKAQAGIAENSNGRMFNNHQYNTAVHRDRVTGRRPGQRRRSRGSQTAKGNPGKVNLDHSNRNAEGESSVKIVLPSFQLNGTAVLIRQQQVQTERISGQTQRLDHVSRSLAELGNHKNQIK